jgi:hypothetical protein
MNPGRLGALGRRRLDRRSQAKERTYSGAETPAARELRGPGSTRRPRRSRKPGDRRVPKRVGKELRPCRRQKETTPEAKT